MKITIKSITFILGLFFSIFLTLFSLDIFTPGLSLLQTISGLLIHNIPTLLSLLALFISWKHEMIGGLIYIFFGLYYLILTILNYGFSYPLASSFMIFGPPIIIGVLFLISWKKISTKK